MFQIDDVFEKFKCKDCGKEYFTLHMSVLCAKLDHVRRIRTYLAKSRGDILLSSNLNQTKGDK